MRDINHERTPLAGVLEDLGLPRLRELVADPAAQLRESLERLYAAAYPNVDAERVAAWIDSAFQRAIADIETAPARTGLLFHRNENSKTSVKEKKSWVV